MTPDHVDPMQWNQAVGIARQSCARIFRDGGSAADAMRAFGLTPSSVVRADWRKAVEAIALSICAKPTRRAA